MSSDPPPVTRFAPSPTGLLHLGHAFSALFAWSEAMKEGGGRFLLRIEDIDPGRCRPEFEEAIFEDLAWLGLSWEEPVRRQSEHLPEYEAAWRRLADEGLAYPCFCTRKEIVAEIARAGAAPHGDAEGADAAGAVDGGLYPGTCRALEVAERERRIAGGMPYAMRMDMGRALARVGRDLEWTDRGRGVVTAIPGIQGDVVLARKEVPTSYHLAVTVDDAAQGVTLVTRGEDLFESTHVHRLLIELLGLPVPEWSHHRLILDGAGRRLAKRDESASLRSLREAGRSARSVREELGFEG